MFNQGAELPGVRLFDIDSFQAPQSEELREIRDQTEQVLAKQIQEFLTWYDCRDMVPLTNGLAEKFGQDTVGRLEAAIRGLHLGPDEATALRCQVEQLAEKIRNVPMNPYSGGCLAQAACGARSSRR